MKRRVYQQDIEAFGLVGAFFAAVVFTAFLPALSLYTNLLTTDVAELGVLCGLVSAAVALTAFVVGYSDSAQKIVIEGRQLARLRRGVLVGVFSVVYASIAFMLFAALGSLVGHYIGDIFFDRVSIVVIGVAAAATTYYVVYMAAASLTAYRLARSLVVFIVSGVLASMITAGDNGWWSVHFSALGSGGTSSAYAFNLTMILSGVFIVGLADYLTQDLKYITSGRVIERPYRFSVIRGLLVMIGGAMIGVGLVPFDVSYQVHQIFGYGSSVGFLALASVTPFLLPSVTRIFTIFSFLAPALAVFSYYMWQFEGRISFTMFELISAVLFIVWLVVFVRQIQAAKADHIAATEQRATV